MSADVRCLRPVPIDQGLQAVVELVFFSRCTIESGSLCVPDMMRYSGENERSSLTIAIRNYEYGSRTSAYHARLASLRELGAVAAAEANRGSCPSKEQRDSDGRQCRLETTHRSTFFGQAHFASRRSLSRSAQFKALYDSTRIGTVV